MIDRLEELLTAAEEKRDREEDVLLLSGEGIALPRAPAPGEAPGAAEGRMTGEDRPAGTDGLIELTDATEPPTAERTGGEEIRRAGTAAGDLSGGREAIWRDGPDGGLMRLYRAAAAAERAVLPPEDAGAERASPRPDPQGLTPEELDRAVRRDSRRYDGGMTIF